MATTMQPAITPEDIGAIADMMFMDIKKAVLRRYGLPSALSLVHRYHQVLKCGLESSINSFSEMKQKYTDELMGMGSDVINQYLYTDFIKE